MIWAALPMFLILIILSGMLMGRIPDADAVEVYNSKHLFGLANGRAKNGGSEAKADHGCGERLALCRDGRPGGDGDRGRGCGGSAGGHKTGQDQDTGKEDAAPVLHREYGQIHLQSDRQEREKGLGRTILPSLSIFDVFFLTK